MYIPKSEIKGVVDRYSGYLKDSGVFIVRMCDRDNKYKPIVRLIENYYKVLDRGLAWDPDIILVFK